MTDPKRARLKLAAVAALFLVPVIVAFVWFVNVGPVEPEAAGARGELVHPARPLGEFELPGADGHAVVTDETLHGRWAIVHVGGADCGAECRENLWEARQVHTRLGRDSIRVQRLYLLVDAGEVADPGFFSDEHPSLHIARIRGDDPLLELFRIEGDAPADAGRTYIIDPLGNLMMSYPPDAPPQDLYEDIKRLLRLSRIG